MRLKLEEDYLQNTKNHEEEVQLRLKFESKLNNMHSAHRDLESKYKRVLTDYSNTQKSQLFQICSCSKYASKKMRNVNFFRATFSK